MRSDNGSNFAGAAKELGQTLKEMDQQVKLFLETLELIGLFGQETHKQLVVIWEVPGKDRLDQQGLFHLHY